MNGIPGKHRFEFALELRSSVLPACLFTLFNEPVLLSNKASWDLAQA